MVSKKGFMGMGIAGLVILSGGVVTVIESFFLPASLNSGRVVMNSLFQYMYYAVMLGSSFFNIFFLMSMMQQIRIANIVTMTILSVGIGTIVLGGILALVGWINYGSSKM